MSIYLAGMRGIEVTSTEDKSGKPVPNELGLVGLCHMDIRQACGRDDDVTPSRLREYAKSLEQGDLG